MPTITLIAGPPCAGKTTLARQLAEPDHVVIDFDDIAVRLGSPRGWRHQQPIVTAASAVMARQLAELRARDDVTAWVIRSAPRAVLRAHLAATLGARVWLLDPGLAECLRRARGRPYGTAQEIRKWYRLYAPSDVDQVPDLRDTDHGGGRDGAGSP
jgi:predicted kinase